MLTRQNEILLKVMEQLNGVSKIEALDILQKVEELLFEFESPIQIHLINTILKTSAVQNGHIVSTEHGYCYLEDDCYWIKVYRPLTRSKRYTYYFIPLESHEPLLFDNEGIINAFRGTPIEPRIKAFIKDHHVTKRNRTTGRLVLIELLDKIDANRY